MEGKDISDQEATLRLQKQILRWVDKSSQDGHTDQIAMSVLPMSGRFKSNGFEYSWDYRQYDKHNPEAFNNPGRFAGRTTPAHRDRLSRSHAGRSNADIRQQAEANEALALNLVDTATSLIRTPAGGISVREWIRSFSQDATKLRGGAADPLLAGAGGGNIRASEGRIPDQAMASKGEVGNSSLQHTTIAEIQKHGYTIKSSDSFSSNYRSALEEAFRKTGVPRSDFVVMKWGRDRNGKSFPVEYRSQSGAEVSIDLGHAPGSRAPATPHIGWQTPGKRSSGGAERGHIFVPDVPFNR